MSAPGMCSVCAGLVWRDVDHDCPPPVVAYTSPAACSPAGLASYVDPRARASRAPADTLAVVHHR